MRSHLASERGTSIIETTIACAILMVVMLGLAGMVGTAVKITENHGHLEARTTEYAQDKLEHLMALAYPDSTSDTTYYPAPATGGTGLAVGGSIDTTATPVNGYVDWLEEDGDMLHGGVTPPTSWFYKRQWQITSPYTGLKQITVVTTVRAAIGRDLLPKSTVTVYKSSAF